MWERFVSVDRSLDLTPRRETARLWLVTERQLECLAWVQEGKSASDIGGILGLSSRTVEGHLLKLCGHLGVKTRVQAVLKARDLGLLFADGTVSLLALNR